MSASHPCTHKSDCMVERYIKTVEEHLRNSHRARGIGTQDHPSPSWPTVRPLTTLRASLVFGRISDCLVTCCSGHHPTTSDPQSIRRQMYWFIYTISTIMPADTWSWPVTGWKLVKADLANCAGVSTRATSCCSITLPARRRNRPVSNPHERAHTG
jgi:hypothetical protein